jgi:hypothetical protein
MLFDAIGNETTHNGSIAVITDWPHYGDHQLAPLR